MKPALKLSYIMLMLLPIISLEKNSSIDKCHVLKESSFFLHKYQFAKERFHIFVYLREIGYSSIGSFLAWM